MQAITDLIPITVFTALVLFIIRELLDTKKKATDESRRLAVYKIFICEELRHNYQAIGAVASTAQKLLQSKNYAPEQNVLEVNTDRYGNDFIRIQLGKEAAGGIHDMQFAKINTTQFEKHAQNLALLDKSVYEKLIKIYKEIRQYQSIRNNIVCFLAGEIDDVRNYFFGTNLELMASGKSKALESIEELHYLLSKQYIEIFAGEVRPVSEKI